jgi:hypothetical protein
MALSSQLYLACLVKAAICHEKVRACLPWNPLYVRDIPKSLRRLRVGESVRLLEQC